MGSLNSKKYIFYLFLFIFSSTPVFGIDNVSLDESQIEAFKAWLATKRTVTVKERGGALSLSGDVRVEYITANEKKNGFKNIGSNSLHPRIANDQFDIEFNMLLDYRTDQTWSTVKVEFDNNMGLIGGTQNRLSLERAFMGFRVFTRDNYTLDFEFGRRKLNYTFDSRIEFGSFMDGVLFKYNQSADELGDLYIYGGPFVVNETQDQFALVAELGILNIYNSGVYFKYSIIDWDTKDFKKFIDIVRFQYINSQFILGYRFLPKYINRVTTLYSAFLINSAAKRYAILNYHLANLAGYVGFNIGELRKRGDWSFDTNVQYVEPQAIPEFDFAGIGHGNSDNIGLFTLNLDGTGGLTTRETAGGKANYVGWRAEFLYLVTDNFTLSQSFKIARSLHFLPTRYSYKQYRLELIYAW